MLAKAPSIFLAEDDPITREVVQSHLLALGCTVQTAASVVDSIRLCTIHKFDALVLDCQLTGGDAHSVLRALRASAHNPNAATAAIAMSAELDDARFDALIAAGFADAMEKPIHRSRLRHALSLCGVTGLADTRAQAHPGGLAAHRVLDDEAGLRACGNAEVLGGLRRLLALELAAYRNEIDVSIARHDAAARRDCVHRMKSALGFCGAMELLFLLNRSDDSANANGEISTDTLLGWHAGMDRLAAALAGAQSTQSGSH